MSLLGRPVYDPNPLRPNPNLQKLMLSSCCVRGLGRTLTLLNAAFHLSAWGLDPVGYSRGWNLSSSPTGVLISCRPFGHSFEPTFFLCPDDGRPAFPFSSACPPERSSHLQHSCILWSCIAFRPLSLGRSYKGRRETPLTSIHWWRQWRGLCCQPHQSRKPLCWNRHVWPSAFVFPLLNVQCGRGGSSVSLPSNELCDKVSTQLFKGGNCVRGKFAKRYPCWPLQCGTKHPAHNLI